MAGRPRGKVVRNLPPPEVCYGARTVKEMEQRLIEAPGRKPESELHTPEELLDRLWGEDRPRRKRR